MLGRVGHLCSKTWDLACLLLGSLIDVSFWTVVGSRVYVQCYVLAMICVAYALGVNPWVTIVPSAAPLLAVWLWVQTKRERNRLALLLTPQKDWNIDKALKEYTELLEKQRKREQTRLTDTTTNRVFSIFTPNLP